MAKLSTVWQSKRLRPVALVAAVILTCVVASIILVVTRTQSPTEVAANAAPPATSVLTAQVEKRSMAATAIGRGTVTTPQSMDVSCMPGSDDRERVFTSKPRYGQPITEGEALAAVNGRPIFALVGDIAAFRDITPGNTGDDVRQVQAALARLGYYKGATNGKYTAATQQAVNTWYTQQGYEPRGPSADSRASLRSAERAVTQAKRALTSANTALARANRPQPKITQPEAAQPQDSKASPEDKGKGSDGSTNHGNAPAAATDTTGTTAQDTAELRMAVADAKADLNDAQLALQEIQRTTGTTIPFCEIVFVPAAPVTASAPAAEPGSEPGDATAGTTWATLNAGDFIVTATLPIREELRPADGTEVTIDLPTASGDTITGTLAAPTTEQAGGGTGAGVPVTITLPTGVSKDALGKNVRVSVNVGTTDGEVLAVPLAALAGTTDGDAKVYVVTGDPTTSDGRTEVRVTTGVTADGMVEVTPVQGTLQPGDSVIVSATHHTTP